MLKKIPVTEVSTMSKMQEGISCLLKYVSIIKRQRRAEDFLKLSITPENTEEALSTSTCSAKRKKINITKCHNILF
jgi:hypothetical protein